MYNVDILAPSFVLSYKLAYLCSKPCLIICCIGQVQEGGEYLEIYQTHRLNFHRVIIVP